MSAALSPVFNGLRNIHSSFGRWIIQSVSEVGSFSLFVNKVFREIFNPPWRGRLVLQQMEFLGNESLNIIMISGFFMGAVFSLQIGHVFSIFGAEGMIGAASGKALTRELSPLITAFLLTGRGGAAITAEISTMKVNEQIDAMESMAVDPVSYLVAPRFIAAVTMTPVLVGIFNFTGMIGALGVGILIFDVDQGVFFEKLISVVGVDDIWNGMVKAAVFGGLIALLACRFGLSASGGAKGVGLATTNSVVTTLMVVLGVDFIITYLQIALGW